MSGEILTVAAYAAMWLLLAAYLAILARRQSRLEADLRALDISRAQSATLSSPPPAPEAKR